MDSVKPEQTITRHKDTASRIIDGEAVILRPMDNRILTLNDTGTRIWELLADRPTIQDVIETITREFEVAPSAATRDVMAFLDEMKTKGLIQSV